MPLIDDERSDLAEIFRLFDDVCQHHFEHSDGYDKSSEGYVEISFGDHFSRGGGPLTLRRITIHSSVFGLWRCNGFDSTAEALTAVRQWHTREMNDVIRP